MTLSIVIPTFNEAATLDELLRRVAAADAGPVKKEIIVVDDGSTDETPQILKRWGDRVLALAHARNRGKGAAVRTGYARATGDWVVVQDADLELDPNDFRALLAKAEEERAAAVYGSRTLPLSGERRPRGVWYFALGGRTLTLLANLLYGTRITDEPTCYKMVRRDVLKELRLTAEGFDFCPELTAKLAKRGVRIVEAPVHYYPRSVVAGKKVRLSDWIQAVWTLVKHRF
jgi:glycosyltransferase involved in cell wall biosynthesis